MAGERWWSHDILYNSDPPGFWDISRRARLQDIKTRAYLNVFGGPFVNMPTAAVFLEHFLENTGSAKPIYARIFIEDNKSAQDFLNSNMNDFMRAAEKLVPPNSTRQLGVINKLGASDYSIPGSMTENWINSIGCSDAWIAAEVTRKNNQLREFKATVYYNIWDFYNWDPDSDALGGFVTDGEMAELHAAGWAKEFEVNNSCYNMTVYWSFGQRMDSAICVGW